MDFTEEQINRYSRHILLPEIGGTGQAKLLKSKVLVVGAGGLGSPLILYLAAAGVRNIGIIDDDVVDLSNLQRQVLHHTIDVGKSKVESAAEAVASINPDINVDLYPMRVDVSNVMDLILEYDVIADGSDNFSTRFLINDACYFARKPLVSAAILRFDAQLATYRPFVDPNCQEAGPCYRCIFREPPPADQIPTCSEAGVLGAMCGMTGAFQATEVIKELLCIGESLAGFMLIFDGLSAEVRKIKVGRDPDCPLCGKHPTILDLSIHD